eukprot:TRINITY_DN58866_c0_g1_i1.p1 TRINITY_DN58866_c0_g1~~TRINITY_DN58866_c0_g1_i1.p1  ORF type:complete len:133 (-),score=21.81 TRINITY_DN58866_c0_g1_i1:8-406(-)
MPLASEKNKLVLACIEATGFGMMGFDRMYMGQIGVGIAKLCTLGGFGVWTMVDYCIVFKNCLAKEDSINSFGFCATFEKKHLEAARWILPAFVVLTQLAGRLKRFAERRRKLRDQARKRDTHDDSLNEPLLG